MAASPEIQFTLQLTLKTREASCQALQLAAARSESSRREGWGLVVNDDSPCTEPKSRVAAHRAGSLGCGGWDF